MATQADRQWHRARSLATLGMAAALITVVVGSGMGPAVAQASDAVAEPASVLVNDQTAVNVVIPPKRLEVHRSVLESIQKLRNEPSVKAYFEKAYAFAIYPTVAKGGFVVGGARGEGEVFEGGKVVGFSVLTQGSIGLQIGGQAYTQLIFFENKEALEKFKEGDAEFAGQASGVAGKAGAGENVDYTRGVAVFSFSQKGLMGEASIGGQSFSYLPYEPRNPQAAPPAPPAPPAPATPAAPAPPAAPPAPAAPAPAPAPAPSAPAAPTPPPAPAATPAATAAPAPAAADLPPLKIEGPDTELHRDVLQALDQLRKHDPKVQGYIQKAHAMVVYPTIAKGGFIVGGARGEGEVIEQGKVIGTSVLTQGSIGLQIGGQAYSQVIFFENKEALEKFKEGDAEFAGQASGVAGKTGAGENVDYTRGVAVFSFSAKGLMGEASIGGQSFSFKPLKKD